MMKLLNLCETTLFLDDINVPVIYSRDRQPQEIDDKLAKRSKNLKYALAKGFLLDVTLGIPAVLPQPFGENALYAAPAPDPIESPYMKRQSVLSSDDHFNTTNQKDLPNKKAPPLQFSSMAPKNDLIQSAKDAYASGKMSAVYTGPATDAGGYANMNRRFMIGLADRGVNLKYDMLQSLNDMDPVTSSRLKELTQVRVPADALKIYGMTAPLHYDWARYKMLFTMMETRRLHKDYVTRCDCADEIIVPSRWCRDTFIESGVKKPISVVPLGVDTKMYTPEAEPIGFSKNLKPFVFLSVFGWSLRKGYDVLLQAFLEEFTSDDPVTLLISSRYFGSTDESKKQVIRNDVARVSAMVSNPKKPQVILFGDVLPDAMMPRLYAAADCYCLISRGEGFGLPYIEAAACGLPVIASRYSGQTDFLDDDNSYLVDVDGFRSAEKTLAWISYFYENAEFPILGSSAVEQTRAHMRRVFENQDEAKAKAAILSERVRKEYDWSVCVNSMYEKLKSTCDAIY